MDPGASIRIGVFVHIDLVEAAWQKRITGSFGTFS